MKRWLIVITSLAVAIPAFAGWQSRDSNYNQNIVAAGGGYTGPGDVITGAAAGYSFRAWTSAVRGNNAVQVCNVGDAACANMVTNATTGDLTITTVGGTDCSVSTCTVKTLYDQSGANRCSSAACDATQATEALRPVFKTSCNGGKPCMQCTGSSSHKLLSANQTGSVDISNPFTLEFAGQRNGAFTSLGTMLSAATSGVQHGYNSSTNQAFIFNGSTVVPGTASDSAYHSIGGLYLGSASSAVYVDGSSVATGNPGGGNITAANGFGICAAGGNFATGFFLEGGFWSGDKSASLSALSTNQHSYWGF